MPEPTIVATGGSPGEVLLDHVLGLAAGNRVPYVPTGMEDEHPLEARLLT